MPQPGRSKNEKGRPGFSAWITTDSHDTHAVHAIRAAHTNPGVLAIRDDHVCRAILFWLPICRVCPPDLDTRAADHSVGNTRAETDEDRAHKRSRFSAKVWPMAPMCEPMASR